MHTKVAHIKQVIKGDGISYNVTYRTKTEEWIATVAIGYADGWLRRLQGFEVLVNGKRVPIVGRVTMDQFMIHLPCEVPLGTKVTLIEGKEMNILALQRLRNIQGLLIMKLLQRLVSVCREYLYGTVKLWK